MSATLRVPTIFTAVDKISSVIKAMGRSVNSFTNKLQSGVRKGNQLFNKLTPSIGEAGKQLLSFLSAATLVSGLMSTANFGIQSIMDYEVALHSLEAVTGESASKFKVQIEDIAKRSKKSAIDVAGSFEIIGSAMSQYLGDPKALGQISEAGILLAKASRQELEPSLEALTSSMNQFGLSADQALKTVNILTAGEVVGSVSTAKATEQLSAFGAVADNVNVTLPESIALIQTLGKKFTGSMQSQIGTASKNLLMIMDSSSVASKQAMVYMKKHGVSLKVLQDRSIPLGERLKELSKIQKDGAAMSLVFGRENAAAGAVIFDQLGTYNEWAETIKTTNKAQEQAATNSDTLKNRIDEAKNSFANWAVSGDKLNPTLTRLKDGLKWVADNIDLCVKVVGYLVGGFLLFKTLLIGTEIVLAAYNIGLGIYAALNTASAIALGTNTLALNAWYMTSKIAAGATKIMAGAQWLLNIAMNANPIGLIVAGIIALIALVAAIIVYWDEWGAAISVFLGPIGLVISIVQSFRRNWDMVVEAFKTNGILGGLKAIGKVLLDAVLQPVQSLLEMLAKIPGLSNLATAGADKIKEIRTSLGVNMEGNNPKTDKQVLENPAVKQNQLISENNTNTKNSLDININDPKGSVTTQSKGKGFIPVLTTRTSGNK